MGAIEDRLEELGLELPEPFARPHGIEFKFDLVRVHGDVAYVSGHGPVDGDPHRSSRARSAPRSTRARLRGGAGDLPLGAGLAEAPSSASSTGSTGWVKALGLVNCAPGFNAMPAVINGFSDSSLELWGPTRGRHARSAIGVAELPFDRPVEVEAVVAIA